MTLILTTISSLLFLVYGLLCIKTNHMVEEFERYGVSRFRTLVGYLELLGGAGQLFGYFYLQPLYILATTGLFSAHVYGSGTQNELKDP